MVYGAGKYKAGDNEQAAGAISQKAGIKDVRANLLPQALTIWGESGIPRLKEILNRI